MSLRQVQFHQFAQVQGSDQEDLALHFIGPSLRHVSTTKHVSTHWLFIYQNIGWRKSFLNILTLLDNDNPTNIMAKKLNMYTNKNDVEIAPPNNMHIITPISPPLSLTKRWV